MHKAAIKYIFKKKCLWVRVAERLLMTSLVPSLSNYRKTPRSKKCIYGQNIIKQTADISQTDWQLLSLVFGRQPHRQRRTLWFAISQAPWLYISGWYGGGHGLKTEKQPLHPPKKTKVNSLISKNIMIFFLSVVLRRLTLWKKAMRILHDRTPSWNISEAGFFFFFFSTHRITLGD